MDMKIRQIIDRTRNRIGKRAVLFSLISLLFSVLFITVFSQGFFTVDEDRTISSSLRVKVIDTYVRNFEVYVGDSIRVSTYRTLDAITIYRDNNGKFFSNEAAFKQMFSSCMICGYTNCSSPTIQCGNSNNFLRSRLDTIGNLSVQQLNINTNYTIHSVNISQSYPFEVIVDINITYNISDVSGPNNYARWGKNKVIRETIPIYGLLDPLGYMNDSSNTFIRRINKTSICERGETCWNPTTTQAFYQERTYKYFGNSTSFLQRYYGNHSASDCCGIETIIHPSEIGGINLQRTYIDNLYWNGTYRCGTHNILSINLAGDEIHLDELSASRFGVTGSSVIYCSG